MCLIDLREEGVGGGIGRETTIYRENFPEKAV